MARTPNFSRLDQLVDTFPIGLVVENFGIRAKVVGYQYSASLAEYTGNLILSDTACKWVADPDKCVRA